MKIHLNGLHLDIESNFGCMSLTFTLGGNFIGNKAEADVKHNILPRQEVINKLRDRGEAILLFGESEIDACKRLRKCELLEPEVNRVSMHFILILINTN